MASTVLPNGIIIPEKYSRDWYNDLYHNWQELDNLLGGGTPKDGTLTIQKNGTTVGTFSANQATNETINITVPDVNDATLTIQRNGTTVDTFTANSSTDKTVDITVPTKTSDLTNDSNFVPSTDLATVATSGNYNDLSNKPTIPTVNNATLTIQKNGTNVQTFTANQSTNATANITVPTKTSDLTNDSGFITSDNTKIPLAGSNQISGSLIPSTDNSIDIGSSTKNIKMLYAKGITIDGKTIDTDANDNMTYDGHTVDTIEEQGDGYIRYSNGIQICWGSVRWQSDCSHPWGAIYESSSALGTYAKSFIAAPYVSVCNMGKVYGMIESAFGTNTSTPSFFVCRGAARSEIADWSVSYIAIGRWK